MDIQRLVEVTEKVNEILPLPKTVTDIMHLLDLPEPKMMDIEKEIMKDQGLAAKVLKMANSAFYRGRRPIETVVDAMVVLGLDSVEALVLSSYAKEFMSKEFVGYAYKKEELWYQSFLSAVLSKNIAKETGAIKPEVAYTAGLLKDIGKVILDPYVLTYRDEINKVQVQENITYLEAEEKVIGINYCQVGAKIAEKWNLSPNLIEAIEYQYNPLLAHLNQHLVSIIHVADSILLSRRTHHAAASESYKFYEKTLAYLNLSKQRLNEIVAAVDAMLNEETKRA